MDDFDLKFPDNFLFGTAVSAYQIEGAWNKDGKSESIWDRHCHEKTGIVRKNYDGDVAIDHYNRYVEDLDLLKELGANSYRFSLAWTRILPEGTGRVNLKGIEFYNRLIDGLLERGIEPVVTIFHWDLPAVLQEKGGWANREVINWFTEYARVCFKYFGDRVKYWITLNEIYVFTYRGYSLGVIPPCIRDYKMAVKAAHHAVVAHGSAVKLYRQTGLNGKIGVALDIVPKTAGSERSEDKYAAEVANATESFYFYDAIVKGAYPELAVKVLKEKNYWPDDIDEKELKTASEKIDFLGVNFYGQQTVVYRKGAGRFDSEIISANAENVAYDNKPCADDCFKLMMKIKEDTGGRLPVIITENGMGSNTDVVSRQEELNDGFRIDYIKKHLTALKKAIDSGVDIKGYFYWSAFDNFEWNWGYDQRFGLVYVDYEDDLKRIKKKSFLWYKEFLEEQGRMRKGKI